MKKYAVLPVVMLLAVCSLSIIFFSFTGKRGGDVFEIYLNGKQVLQQFVHADKSVKSLQFFSVNEQDKIDVFYSHCGSVGKNRVITIRNEKNDLIKKFTFPDVTTNRSFMRFFRKDIPNNKGNKMSLYYSSKELPAGKLLATIAWRDNKNVVKL